MSDTVENEKTARTGVAAARRFRTAPATAAGAVLALITAVLVLVAPDADATAPTNDVIGHATVITTLPTTITEDTSEATGAVGDGPCVGGSSVWFRFRSQSDARMAVSTVGSDYDTMLAVSTGPQGSRQIVSCGDDSVGLAAALRFRATAGSTYWIAVSACCGRRAVGGHLRLAVTRTVVTPRGHVTITKAETGGLSGDLLVSGTATCDTAAAVELSGYARQRVDPGVARGYFGDVVGFCTPGQETAWRTTVTSETGWAFQPGVRVLLEGSWSLNTGFRSSSETYRVVLTPTNDPDARHLG